MKLFENRTIVSFGDSVMKGIVTEKDMDSQEVQSRYVITEYAFTSLCAKRLGAKISNYGRFGNNVRRGLRDVQRYYSQMKAAQYALLEFGGNDSNHDWKAISENPEGEFKPETTLETFRSCYSEMIDLVKSSGCSPVILSLPPVEPDRFFKNLCRGFCRRQVQNVLRWLGGNVNPISNWHEMYNLELYRIASEHNIPVIDITSCFLSRRDYAEYLCDDGMHPNERGHRLIADVLISC